MSGAAWLAQRSRADHGTGWRSVVQHKYKHEYKCTGWRSVLQYSITIRLEQQVGSAPAAARDGYACAPLRCHPHPAAGETRSRGARAARRRCPPAKVYSMKYKENSLQYQFTRAQTAPGRSRIHYTIRYTILQPSQSRAASWELGLYTLYCMLGLCTYTLRGELGAVGVSSI